ncbi:uncharacterized protein LOC143231622 isoform X5 [Tachypleus tridentatus]|uniref:uncharacterized protein LOC143231622 isoform X5 n=1 Tax=Tachypleus tridentatus TaxID=6853 RepID=UPI003FD043F1
MEENYDEIPEKTTNIIMKVKTGQSDEVISEFQESDIGEPDSSNDDILSVKKEKESENEFYQLGSGLESTLACVQPSENYQCPEGLTLRNNLCYPSQPGTEEETYVPSPRKKMQQGSTCHVHRGELNPFILVLYVHILTGVPLGENVPVAVVVKYYYF